MMKKFVIAVCGSIVGTTIAASVLMLGGIVLSFAIMLSAQNTATASVQDKSILHISLQGSIGEVASGDNMQMLSMLTGQEPPVSLSDILKAVQVAKNEKNIKGIYLDCGGSYAAPATLSQIRQALIDFKHDCPQKWVYAYAGSYEQGDYYVASAADSIFVNPIGGVDLHGLATAIPYMKKALDKVGIDMMILRVGTFKSAVEPYMLDSISPANRLQTQTFLNNVWNVMSTDIATARGISKNTLNALADAMVSVQPADSLKAMKLIDNICYEHGMESKLKALTGLDDDEELRLVSPRLLAQNYNYGKNKDGKIAVVYAVGEIDGQPNYMDPSAQMIDSESLIDDILSLKDDGDVKGMVLRINSPGGSFYGSEQIWEALEQFKKSGKPLTVSMGDYAASGGYYIASGADHIFADSTTITGSIGIFGIVPVAQRLMQNTLGINVNTVSTNDNAAMTANMMGLLTKMPTPSQIAALQSAINRNYGMFVGRVSKGRDMDKDSVEKIAQGRVWDAINAKKIKLIDEFGGLQAAIDWTARKAGLNNGYYEIEEYTAEPDKNLATLLQQMRSHGLSMQMRQQMGIFYTSYEQLRDIMGREHMLCLMPEMCIR